MEKSGALEAAAEEGRMDVLRYLLPHSNTADVQNAIAAAEKCQREDVVGVLRLYLTRSM